MRARPRTLIFVVGGVVLLAVGIHLSFVTWLAHAIADAPNRGRPLTALHDPISTDVSRLGVTQSFRVAVGPLPASLSLWVLDPKLPAVGPRGTILVLHGIRDRKSSMLAMGTLLSRQGFRAILIDLRGHGESTGDWLTYGIVESRDLSQVVDELSRRGLLSGSLGVYGPSYGGSVALQLAARDPRVRAVVVVSTFSAAHQAVTDYVRRTAPRWLVPQVTIDQAFRKAEALANVKLESASPARAIAATKAECLILHGGADPLLPPRHASALVAASQERARLIVVDRATHDSIFADETGVLSREALAWFRRWLSDSAPE